MPEELFIGLHAELFAFDLENDFLFLDVIGQSAGDFVDDGAKNDRGAANFARAGIIDELVELGGDFVGLLDDFFGALADIGSGPGLFGNDLSATADDVEGVAGFVGEAGGGEVHFAEVGSKFAGSHEAELKVRGFGEVAEGEGGAEGGAGGQDHDDRAEPEVAVRGGLQRFSGQDENQAVKGAFL